MQQQWTEVGLKSLSDKEFIIILEEGVSLPEKLVRKLPRDRKRLYRSAYKSHKQPWTSEALNSLKEQDFLKILTKGIVLPNKVLRFLDKERKVLYHRADWNSAFLGLGVEIGIWGNTLKSFRVRVNPQGDHLPPVVRKRRFFFTATA